MPLALYALAAAAFAIGTTEFVVVGLLPTMSTSLAISLSTAGLLVTGYATGVAVGGPFLTVTTGRLPRRKLLIGLMAVFSAGHLVMAAAPNFSVLLAVRLLTASCHGAFFGVGAVVAMELTDASRRSRAIAVMFAGLTTATVVGVPAGTLLGQVAGWRAPFLGVAVLAALAALAAARLLPRSLDVVGPVATGPAPRVRRGPLAAALTTTVLGWGSQFVVFTFLAAYLRTVTGFSTSAVTAILLVFGIAGAIGNLLAGHATDRSPRAAVPVTLVLLAGILLAFAAAGDNKPLTVLLVFLWGIAGFALVPGLQTRVLTVAGEGSALASSLNIAAFNVGIAGGSAVGSLFVGRGHLTATPVAAAALALLAVPLSLVGATTWESLRHSGSRLLSGPGR